jgi:hypothetical protein
MAPQQRLFVKELDGSAGFSPGVRRAVPGGHPNAEPGDGQRQRCRAEAPLLN